MAASSLATVKRPGLAPGLMLALIIAAGAGWAAVSPLAQQMGLGTLTLAIVFGIAIGNSRVSRLAPVYASGVDFSKTVLLRLGIILYGFRISFQEIALVGWEGILLSATMVAVTFTLAMQLGMRLFKLDRDTAMLIGAGSAICGAAAVMAVAPVIKGPAHKVSVAVATVVVFGTLGMFLYPLSYPLLGLSEQAYGMFVGSTVHEVAQVVVAGEAVGAEAAAVAVIVKMVRVMMLVPFLLLLSCHLAVREQKSEGAGACHRITIPWFALLFLVAVVCNSIMPLPEALVRSLVQVDTAVLAMAMAALGVRTDIGAVKHAGTRPLLLAATLFIFLIVGGYMVNTAVRLVL